MNTNVFITKILSFLYQHTNNQKIVHSSESHPECQFAVDSGTSEANEKSFGMSASNFGKSVKTLPAVTVFPTRMKEELIVYQQISK